MFVLTFSLVSPAFATQSLDGDGSKETDGLSKGEKESIEGKLQNFKVEKYADNIDEISTENRKIINDTIKDLDIDSPDTLAQISEKNEMIITAPASKADTTVAITDNIVEVVEKVGKNDFLINGEKNHVEVTVETVKESPGFKEKTSGVVSTQAADNWIEVSYRSGPWTHESSHWIDVNAERNFSKYSAAAMSSIIGGAVGLAFSWSGFFAGVAGGIAIGIAYDFISSDDYPTNAGKMYLASYKNSPYPTADKRVYANAYAVYNGDDIYLGTDNTYYYKCLGCGGA